MQVHQPIREEQKALRELKYREDIVTANTHKGRELVAVDVKDCIRNPNTFEKLRTLEIFRT